ncbi:uncharacterized protein [Triticum aestivum]|uniref:uncharacterized protein n=1 Tax=Triticum aestivum TaxID=4565 RepID=UPI001D0273C6|nr:uncharacterized protein LOC123074026 [Triticum aestivum]
MPPSTSLQVVAGSETMPPRRKKTDVGQGVYENGGEIAVKILNNIPVGLDDTKFLKEFNNLRGLKHQNIVELVGFCNESVEGPAMFEGKQVTAVSLRTALCFEYVSNGSLHKHISDQKTGLNWHTRYRIIKGICEGLKYLREGLGYPVMHFDLKPDNILLDNKMMPKIADFGLSKLFGEENTTRAMSAVGTLKQHFLPYLACSGYWPPEYIKCQIISGEFDIFSLGVIIVKIMTGHQGYNSTVEMMTRKSVTLVQESWKKKLRETVSPTSLEVYCNQAHVNSLFETSQKFYQDSGENSPILIRKNNSITIKSRSSSGNFRYAEPRAMPFSLLKVVTSDFSREELIGRGGYGGVYKGVYGDGQIAVKLYTLKGIDNKQFQNAIEVHKKFHHENVAQLVGYCYETEEVVIPFNGKHVVVGLDIHMAICLEYFPNGSLNRYISDVKSGLDWCMRYQIIKGLCDGLRYLHEGLESPVIHMNLKPSNILMDEKLTPKIGDFGLARFGAGKSDRTMDISGAREYMPPEFIEKQVISKKHDIYSLGVIIIKLMTGVKMYLKCYDMSSEKFIELTLENWRERLQKTVDATLIEGYCEQVKKCLDIALTCLASNRRRRPTIGDIVHTLNETETLIPQVEIILDSELLDSEDSDQLLHVHPSELYFLPAMSSVEVPRKKVAMISSCSVQLNNKGDDRVAFMLVAKSPKRYLTKKPLCGVVPPGSTYTLTLTMLKQQPLPSGIDGEFFTLYSLAVNEYDLQDEDVEKDSISVKYNNFFEKTKEKAGADQEVVQEMTLKVLCCQHQEDDHVTSSSEVITTSDAQQVSSIDVHPTEPWIITTNNVGSLRSWNYKTMLWDWSKDWECTRTFQGHIDRVMQVKFNPEDKDSFASASRDGTVKIWKLGMGQCVDKLEGHVDHVSAANLHPELPMLITGSLDGTVRIWNSTTYKLENIIGFNLGAVYAVGCIKGSRRFLFSIYPHASELNTYSLRSELLVAEMDVSRRILILDTSISETSNSEWREYVLIQLPSHVDCGWVSPRNSNDGTFFTLKIMLSLDIIYGVTSQTDVRA